MVTIYGIPGIVQKFILVIKSNIFEIDPSNLKRFLIVENLWNPDLSYALWILMGKQTFHLAL